MFFCFKEQLILKYYGIFCQNNFITYYPCIVYMYFVLINVVGFPKYHKEKLTINLKELLKIERLKVLIPHHSMGKNQ